MPRPIIHVDPEFKALIPPLSSDERAQLEANLLEDGCRDALVVWREPGRQTGTLVDGHNRHELCQRYRIPFRLTFLDFADRDSAMQWVVLNQMGRRNLDDDQRAILAARLQKITSREAKRLRAQKAGRANGKNGNLSYAVSDKINGKRDTREEASQRLHVPRRKLDRAIRLMDDAPNLAEQVLKGKLTLILAERHADVIRRDQERAEALKDAPRGSHVLAGDFRKVGSRVEDESVDLVLTDPPYLGQYVDLYRDLSALASRVLRPGGLCIAYSGVMFLPEVLNGLSEHLKYVWTFGTVFSGDRHRPMRPVHMHSAWKPTFLFAKPPLNVWWAPLCDLLPGTREKSLHDWQQPEVSAAYLIERLSPAGGLVVDPMCGSGTTLVAAKQTGRRWLGIELDKGVAAVARRRVQDACS